jgi:hypothetical protein
MRSTLLGILGESWLVGCEDFCRDSVRFPLSFRLDAHTLGEVTGPLLLLLPHAVDLGGLFRIYASGSAT